MHLQYGYYGSVPSYIKVVPPKKTKKLYIFGFSLYSYNILNKQYLFWFVGACTHVHYGYYGCAPSYIKVVPPKKQKELNIFVLHYIHTMSLINTYFDLLVHVHYGYYGCAPFYIKVVPPKNQKNYIYLFFIIFAQCT